MAVVLTGISAGILAVISAGIFAGILTVVSAGIFAGILTVISARIFAGISVTILAVVSAGISAVFHIFVIVFHGSAIPELGYRSSMSDLRNIIQKYRLIFLRKNIIIYFEEM